MVELNGSRVAVLRSQYSEFGMISLKAADVADKTRGSPARRKVRVALRADCIACGRQANRSTVIGVAGRARRRVGLGRVM
jgi:hypothetical protein